MSYDLTLYDMNTGDWVFDRSPTYNYSGMIRFADRVAFQTEKGRSFGALHKTTGKQSLEWLNAIDEVLNAPHMQGALMALEPPNKWGDLNGLRDVFRALIHAATEHQDWVWHESGDGDTDHSTDDAFFWWFKNAREQERADVEG